MRFGFNDVAFVGALHRYIGPVQDYIDRVVFRDEQAGNFQGLEVGVRDAYDVFIRACLDTGDLGQSGGVLSQANSIIKASCILAGARTLAGALVPLVGSAPTNYNFVAGDYNRKTGLVGDGSTKYLDSKRANDADPQDDQHFALYSPDNNSSSPIIASDDSASTNGMSLLTTGNAKSRTDINTLFTATGPFRGMSRASAAAFNIRYNGSTVSSSVASAAPTSSPILVYKLKNLFGVDVYSASRLAFYSIGESLDLALLDARVTALMNALAAAIP